MKNVEKYLPRLFESELEEQLSAVGGILIEGPKWCGKSTTARRYAKTVVELQKPNVFRKYKAYADMGDENLLSEMKPILFDEWQKIPDLWDYIRSYIDQGGIRGEFILTGSTKPIEDKNRHSGAGRFVKMLMRTMSLWESGDSTGGVSLADLFAGNNRVSGTCDHTLSRLAFLICRGGWPEVMFDNEKTALRLPRRYLDVLLDKDLTEIDDIKRNPKRARAILKAYARNISTPAKLTTIQRDIEANDAVLDPRTLDSYINAFEKLFVIEDIMAWSPSLRSKTTIRTANTRQFADPSLAAAVLDITPNDLMNDIKTFGLMFESLAIRDLRVYAESLNGEVFQYRDSKGLEADAIIHLYNGNWAAVEVKLGGNESIDEAAKNLLKLKEKVNTDKMREPAFLMVLTGMQYAYRRPDGVLVVPIGCLKN